MKKTPKELLLLSILPALITVVGPVHSPGDSLRRTPNGGIVRAESDPKTVYGDVTLREEADVLRFGNSKLMLEFGKGTGRWRALRAEGIDGNILGPRHGPTIDFRVDGSLVMAQYEASLLKHNVEVDQDNGAVSLDFVYGVLTDRADRKSRAYDFELTCRYTLFADSRRLDRSARLLRSVTDRSSEKTLRLNGFVSELPGAAVGDTTDCVVDVPGPFFPSTFVAAETPYEKLSSERIGFHSAPDAGFGLVVFTNKRRGVALGSWMDTAGEVNYGTSIRGDGERITVEHDNHRAYRLAKGQQVESDVHRIVVADGELPAILHEYRAMCEKRMPLDRSTPAWVREMILLEVYPRYFAGGFKELTGKLPFYREVGFNTLYLMPHWSGGYSPIDLYKVEPRYGTEAELKEMVEAAHKLGMRVLFDMVIHGFNENSPVPKERPELFVHREDGSLARHPTWKSITTDWASPAYQQYMTDLVRHDVRTYDIDGYRVDAASYKGPSWDPNLPYPAYRSGSAAPELMKVMLDAMREIKPDAVLLSEVFGPVFYTVCNLVHDNQTSAPQQLLEQMEAGKIQAWHYKAHMANVFDALPRGVNRVFFARNHDTSWFYHFNGYTQRFMAMDAIHALCAIPEVFAGDPRNGPHPDDKPATYDYYRKLFALRKDYPELGRGELLLREVQCDNPWVFTALRRLKEEVVLVVVSLSEERQRAAVKVVPDDIKVGEVVQFVDPIAGQTFKVIRESGDERLLRLRLKPYQVLVTRL